MKEKGKIPLLVGHIVGSVGLLILMVIVFVIFVFSGAIAGAIGSIGGAESGSEAAGKLMLLGYIIDLLLALAFSLGVVNLCCGFRKKPSGKTLSAFMIADLSLAGLLCMGVASYFITNAIANISSGSDASGSVVLLAVVSFIALAYVALYGLTIAFIYVPRIKGSKEIAKGE